MDKVYFIELQNKYLNGTATDSERNCIINYYNLFEQEPEVLESLSRGEKDDLRQTIQVGVWNKIERVDRSYVRIAHSNIFKMAVVGAVLLAIVLISIHPRNTSSLAAPIANLTPSRNNNHVVSLPDGTTVMLNAGSTIRYPKTFTGATREVYISGLAYFDVHPSAGHPFIVHAGNVHITVLGTSFNVKALSADSCVTVTVKGGKVQVNDAVAMLGTLEPRQQIIYNKASRKVVRQQTDMDSCLAWRALDCVAENVSIPEAVHLLSERFGVTISVDPEVADVERFTATFTRNASLEQSLESICEFNGATYEYDKKKAVAIISKAKPVRQ